MIKGTVYLKNLSYEKILELAYQRNNKRFISNNEYFYSEEHIKQAIEANIKKNLNYNCNTGITRYGSTWMGGISNKSDLTTYETAEEVIEWEFLNWIMNSAGRLKRGYKAIG